MDDATEWEQAADWSTALQFEYERIVARRERCPDVLFTDHHVGLALSGGGIRSATFSVGVLRSLSRLGVMRKVDYLSTVSGGGYAGAFYCSLFVPPQLRGLRPGLEVADTADRAAELHQALGDDPLGSDAGREAVDQLRQGGNYLMPAGTSDTFFAAVIAARNWIAVFLVTGVALLACFLSINVARMLPIPWVRDANLLLHPERVGRALWSSYLWYVPLLLVPLWLLPCAWAFWMTRGAPLPASRRERWDNRLPAIVAIATALVFGTLLFVDPELARSTFSRAAGYGTMMGALLGIGYHRLARARITADDAYSAPGDERVDTAATLFAKENRIRAKLGRWLFRGAIVCAGLAALALIDDLGRGIYCLIFLDQDASVRLAVPALPPSLLAAVALTRWLLTQGQASHLLTWPRLGLVLRRSGRVLAALFALAVLVLLLSFWSAIAYEIVWHDRAPAQEATFAQWGAIARLPGWLPPLAITGFTAFCAIGLGNVRSFLNQSSLAAFYAGRLRRAYLGATNRTRRETALNRADMNPDVEHPEDDIDLRAYYHPSVCAPLHIINVTINETTARSSNVIQRDRKGKSMTVSCAGYGTTPGSSTEAVRVFDLTRGEQLPLSTWIGISGAAFSTGVGQNTSLGQSLLAAMVNMRLGYWWDAPTSTKRSWHRRAAGDLVQSYLLREARANYEGTHTDRWYLSDGGHYENTGIYELVRRRVGFILACDNGADPHYEFGDLINLVRKLRIDFEVETEFVGTSELDMLFGDDKRLRNAFGTLRQLAPRSSGANSGVSAGPYATLARLRYRGPADRGRAPSTLLLIKPRISGAELPDLLRYREVNTAFPQQPTADQFFDEAQWESYFRLGELITDTLFEAGASDCEPPAQAPWRPVDLALLPETQKPAS